ncbi:MAG: cell division protein FtsZ [Patescibacteria group bacterium]
MAKRKKPKNINLAKIRIVGVGGAGGNAVTRMSDELPRGTDSVVINTDVQDLNFCISRKKVYIGKNLTKGLGTGMNPDLGRQAAEENQAEIAEVLSGADMVFLTAGFGGGTGTGALPVVAEIAKDLGILTVAVVTKPFVFEGFERRRIAEEGITRIKDKVDALITIPNDRIFSVINQNTSLTKAFEAVDEILKNSVIGVADLITTAGIINVDFADVKAIIQNAGSAIIGIGYSSGAERATTAAHLAINSPLLEISIDGAKRILFSVSGHRDLKMSEINDVARMIAEHANSSAKIIFGAHHDRKLKKGQLKVTLIAADFNGDVVKSSNNGILPNLFISEEIIPSSNKDLKEKIEMSAISGIKDVKKKEKEEMINEEKNGNWDDVYDIPAFLRKKRK